MKLSLRTRKALSLLILCVALPAYIFAAVSIVGMFERPHMLVELGIYAAAGILWALPFRAVFRGIGGGDRQGTDSRGTD